MSFSVYWPGSTSESRQAMQERQDVEQDVQLVGGPEELVCLASDDRMSKDEYDAHDDEQRYTCQAWNTNGMEWARWNTV